MKNGGRASTVKKQILANVQQASVDKFELRFLLTQHESKPLIEDATWQSASYREL